MIQAAAVMAEERVGGGATRPNAYGDLAFTDGDTARPKLSPNSNPNNPTEYDYWDHVDYVISTAEANGLVIGLLPMFISYREEGHKYLNPTNAHAYGKFLGTRYTPNPTSSGSLAVTMSQTLTRNEQPGTSLPGHYRGRVRFRRLQQDPHDLSHQWG